jgi:hypothetical protein
VPINKAFSRTANRVHHNTNGKWGSRFVDVLPNVKAFWRVRTAPNCSRVMPRLGNRQCPYPFRLLFSGPRGKCARRYFVLPSSMCRMNTPGYNHCLPMQLSESGSEIAVNRARKWQSGSTVELPKQSRSMISTLVEKVQISLSEHHRKQDASILLICDSDSNASAATGLPKKHQPRGDSDCFREYEARPFSSIRNGCGMSANVTGPDRKL